VTLKAILRVFQPQKRDDPKGVEGETRGRQAFEGEFRRDKPRAEIEAPKDGESEKDDLPY
jgi:hypothetical protein